MSLIETFLPLASHKTAGWITEMRDRHLPVARPFHSEERVAMRNHFDESLLDSARVQEVSEIEKPPFYDGLRSQLSFVGMRFSFDFANVSGVTFDNCILVTERPPSTGLLFHEMVHVEQYRQLGIQRFTGAYLRGFAENQFVYEEIPLERIAHQMTARYHAGERFRVGEELAYWLGEMQY